MREGRRIRQQRHGDVSPGSKVILCLLLATGCCHGFTTTTSHLRQAAALVQQPSSSIILQPPSTTAIWTRQQASRPAISQSLYALQDDLMERLPSQSVISAVEASSRSDGVVASDVAASAGISLAQAQKDLTALASISQGDIAVSADGELIYSFPPNLPSVLQQNSAKYKALETFRKVWPAVFWGIRVSFGVALLASVLAIFSTIFFISATGGSSDDDRDDRGGGFGGGRQRRASFGFGYSPWFGPSPFDFFYYRPYGSYGYYAAEQRRDPEELGFLESVFSYIFGDGDPNANVEEMRLSKAAQVIRQNKGAVTAEQLAPFCDEAPKPSDVDAATYVDESYVLPIVSALNGAPQLTEDGDIIYVFDELQQTTTSSALPSAASMESSILARAGLSPKASTREIKQLLEYNGIGTRGALERSDLLRLLERALPPPTPAEQQELLAADLSVLQEEEIPFSVATDFNKLLAGGLGVVNLGGALYLGNQLSTAALYGIRLPAFYGVVQSLYPALLGYAILYNVIPLLRNLWNGRENAKIQQRNSIRRQWQAKLASTVKNTTTRLGRKLLAASNFGQKTKRLSSSQNVVFDTRQTSMEELEAQKAQQSLADFDKLLEQDDSDESSKPFQ